MILKKPMFIDRVYRRRNQSVHGSVHLDNDPTGGLINDTDPRYLAVRPEEDGRAWSGMPDRIALVRTSPMTG